MAQSPASSPRLPSPPPMAEDQIGPTSPGGHGLEDLDKLGQSAVDYGAARRIRPGTKSMDMLEGPPLVDVSEIDSAFQLTEHLKALFASITNASPQISTPITRATAQQLSKPPPGVDRGIWLYELCRLLVTRANVMLVALFEDSPPCSATTCSEMRASEWQYLCAAHDPPKACCAIDYCCHTLDWAATQLTSSKLFPSRLALGTNAAEGGATPAQQLRKMTEIFRRVYRIFAHAWFSHREVFWKVESATGLYVFFKTVCDDFRLIPEDSYTVPPEAEGAEQDDVADSDKDTRREERTGERGNAGADLDEEVGKKDTTKRHHRGGLERTGSISTVIHEEVEEEDDDVADDDESAVPARGEVVQLPSPPEEKNAAAGSLQIREDLEVSVEATRVPAEEKQVGGITMEAQSETAISAPTSSSSAGGSNTSGSPVRGAVANTASPKKAATSTSPIKAAADASKSVEAAEDKTTVAPMQPQKAAAGKEDDATKTVAD